MNLQPIGYEPTALTIELQARLPLHTVAPLQLQPSLLEKPENLTPSDRFHVGHSGTPRVPSNVFNSVRQESTIGTRAYTSPLKDSPKVHPGERSGCCEEPWGSGRPLKNRKIGPLRGRRAVIDWFRPPSLSPIGRRYSHQGRTGRRVPSDSPPPPTKSSSPLRPPRPWPRCSESTGQAG